MLKNIEDVIEVKGNIYKGWKECGRSNKKMKIPKNVEEKYCRRDQS